MRALWPWAWRLRCRRPHRSGIAGPRPLEHDAQPHQRDQHQLGEKEMGDHGTTPSYRWSNEGIVPGFQVAEISRRLEVHDLVGHRLRIALGRHGGRYSKTHSVLSSLASVVLLSDDLPWMSLGPVRVLDAQRPTRGIPRRSRSRARPLLALGVQGSRGTASERITKV